MIEPELAVARRAFPEAQRLFDGAVLRRVGQFDVGWHEVPITERGALAVVRIGAGLDDLIGEVIAVRAGGNRSLVWVWGARDVPADISLYRRAFMGIGLLSLERASAVVEVIDPAEEL